MHLLYAYDTVRNKSKRLVLKGKVQNTLCNSENLTKSLNLHLNLNL